MECVLLAVQSRKHSISHFLWVFSCHRKVYFEQLRELGHFTPKSSFPTVMLFILQNFQVSYFKSKLLS